MNPDVPEALSTWQSGWLGIAGHAVLYWIYQLDMREKEALTPFNRVVFVHPISHRPMKLTRRKLSRARKVLQVSRRRRRNSTLAQVNSPA